MQPQMVPMIRSIKIHGYRGFRDLTLENLGQINLLVGKNNSGKSSVLEAIQLLASGISPDALLSIIQRRGEQKTPEVIPGRAIQAELDVCHLFYGHELSVGTSFSVATTNDLPGRAIEYKIVEPKPEDNLSLFAAVAAEEGVGPKFAISISAAPTNSLLGNPLLAGGQPPLIPLSRSGTVKNEAFQIYYSMARTASAVSVQSVSTESVPWNRLTQLWNDIALTPAEERVINVLRSLDPRIERIAPSTGPQVYMGAVQRAGFKVKMTDVKEPVPIGSLGDGVWRMLALAVAISRAKDGLLLVDDIDTGFHYSVMGNVWNMLSQAANDLNVQVFATTQSSDCINSLASICHSDSKAMNRITIQRIEAQKEVATRYTESQIVAAATQQIELR